jgi:hypothetical protein
VVGARIERDVDDLLRRGSLRGLTDDVVEHRLDPYEAADRLLAAAGHERDPAGSGTA